MKSATIFIFAILVVFANAQFMKKNAQNSVLAQIDSEHFGNAILSTIAVHFETETPIEETSDLLQQILSTLVADGQNADSMFQQFSTNANAIIEQDNQCIATTTDNLETENQILESNQEYLADLQSALQDAQTQLGQVNNALDEGNATRAEQNAVFTQNSADTSDAIAAIDEAFALVQHLQSGTSFAQLKSHFQRVQQKLKAHEKSHVLYAPIIQIMTQLASKADQEAVQKILDLLSRIKAALVDTQAQDLATETQQQQDWDDQFTSLSQQQQSLGDKVSQLSDQIADTQNIIDTKTQLISDLEAQLSNCQSELENTTADLNAKTSLYNGYKAEFDREVEILNKVIDHFNTKIASMQDYLKERVNV